MKQTGRAQAGMLALLLAPVFALAQTTGTTETVRYRCEAVYQPQRSVWARDVELVHDERRLIDVRVDGVSVYSFRVDGAVVYTALDNERIVFDAQTRRWSSDWRGLFTSAGRCEKE